MKSDTIRTLFESHGVLHFKMDEPMSLHTTWRIGGCADVFVMPHTMDELIGALVAAKSIGLPWTVIGRGSNLLVLDGGVRGLVVKLHDSFAQQYIEGHSMVALSGRSIVSLANIAVKHGLAGLEFATGIPGSVGGAVMMNAGAHGGQVSDVLEWAEVVDADGALLRLTHQELRFGYRYSVLKDDPKIVVRAKFNLSAGDANELMSKVKTWSQRRLATQPLSLPNCGSVFRNPEGAHAAQLIEAAGLKGYRHGDAQISEKHANFIVNLGAATAEDVLWLIDYAQRTIQEKYGLQLETEVRVVGEPPRRR